MHEKGEEANEVRSQPHSQRKCLSLTPVCFFCEHLLDEGTQLFTPSSFSRSFSKTT